MKGKRIAILGLGRSGLAIGKAALQLGADPIVFDEKAESDLPKRDVLEEARMLGLRVELGYKPNPIWFTLGDWQPEIVVTNPAVPKWHSGLADAVQRGIEVISEVEFAYRISRAPIVAITGTNGKSTTTVMTYLCLRSCGIDAVLCGNIFGSGYPEVPLTEAALASTPDQVLVAEISSFQLEWVNGFRPLAAAITNITPDHMDRYSSFEDYAAAKRRIHEFQSSAEYAIISGERVATEAQVWRVGEESRVDGDYLYLFQERIAKNELPFTEDHNFVNACTAALLSAAVLRSRNIQSVGCILEGLKTFKGIAHRMERLGSAHGVEVINNSMCTNPAAVVNSSRGLRNTAHLLLGGTNKKLDFDPLREFLESSGHKAYIFGSDADDLYKMLGSKHQTYRTMEEAFRAATEQAKPGDTIMLAPGCASTDQFRDFRHRGDVFKAIAMEWLNS